MRPALVIAMLFAAFTAAGTSDYQIAVGMAADRGQTILIAQESQP